MSLQKEAWDAPQVCPECEVDLADHQVPPEYEAFAGAFTLAMSQGDEWLCPVCGFRWPRYDPVPSKGVKGTRPHTPKPTPGGPNRRERRALRKQENRGR